MYRLQSADCSRVLLLSEYIHGTVQYSDLCTVHLTQSTDYSAVYTDYSEQRIRVTEIRYQRSESSCELTDLYALRCSATDVGRL